MVPWSGGNTSVIFPRTHIAGLARIIRQSSFWEENDLVVFNGTDAKETFGLTDVLQVTVTARNGINSVFCMVLCTYDV